MLFQQLILILNDHYFTDELLNLPNSREKVTLKLLYFTEIQMNKFIIY